MGRKWEEKYNQYLGGEMDSKYKDLQEKMQNKTASKEEYKEFQAIEKTISNLPKVQNVLELRDKLQKELDEIKVEIARIQTVRVANEEERTLEDEVNKISAEISRVEKELKRKDLTSEESEKLKQEYANLMAKRDDNNKKYQNVQKIFADNKKSNSDKLNKMSIEELNAKSFELSTKISKCNMVANNLMQGLSWDRIDLKLDDWKSRKFTAKEKISEKVKTETEGKDIDIDGLENKIIKETKRQIGKKSNEIDDTELVDELEELGMIPDFDTRHPRLAKIKNWFKEKFKKIKDFIVMDEESLENNDEEIGDNNEETKDTDNEFKKYLKEVAEKGMDGIKAEKQIEARKKQAEYKKAAYARETEKFGKDYADKSYNSEEAER